VSFGAISTNKTAGVELEIPVPPDWPFLVKGLAVIYEPQNAKAFGRLFPPQRTTRQKEGLESIEWPMSPDSPAGPAVLVNQFGEGNVITFACSPDFSVGSEMHLVEDRQMLAHAVRLLNRSPRVQIKAPVDVETVVTDDPVAREVRIHFICWNPGPQTMAAHRRPNLLPGLIEDRLCTAPKLKPLLKSIPHRQLIGQQF
jgi:hypothetical protein